MARDIFSRTLTYVDPVSGALMPLDGASVTVYNAGTTVKPTLYAVRDTANLTQITNPFTVGANGLAEFWINPGDYDILVHDNDAPARAADKTFSWSALPSVSGGIPSAFIAADAGLSVGAFGASAKRSVKEIGDVWMWWRPDANEPLPTGAVPLDGRTIPKDNGSNNGHQFTYNGAITLPDMRNAFPLGADTPTAARVALNGPGGATTGALAGAYVGEGQPAVASSDAPANAPGLSATGGSHFRNLQHAHDMAHTHDMQHTHGMDHIHSHTHTHVVPGHGHGRGDLSVNSGNANINLSINGGGGIGVSYVATGVSSRWGNFNDLAYDTGHGHGLSGNIGNIGNANGDNNFNTQGASTSNTSSPLTTGGAAGRTTTDAASTANTGPVSTPNTGNQLSATQDIRPRYVGFLMLMKVRHG